MVQNFDLPVFHLLKMYIRTQDLHSKKMFDRVQMFDTTFSSTKAIHGNGKS